MTDDERAKMQTGDAAQGPGAALPVPELVDRPDGQHQGAGRGEDDSVLGGPLHEQPARREELRPHDPAEPDAARARARELPAAAARDRARPGDARVPRQQPEQEERAERELRARGDGAASRSALGNYTEEDIREAARAFTGWSFVGDRFVLNERQHDFGEKKVLGRTGKWNGDEVLDILLDQAAAPRFLASRILGFFVTPEPARGDGRRATPRCSGSTTGT